jgi:hypothetical protein
MGCFDPNLDWTAAMQGDVTEAMLDLINAFNKIK